MAACEIFGALFSPTLYILDYHLSLMGLSVVFLQLMENTDKKVLDLDFLVLYFRLCIKQERTVKVFVYYNLHKKTFSVKALEGNSKGLVIAHANELTLYNVTFRVSQAGRARVLKEQRKNVHAGVVGQWFGDLDTVIRDTAKTAITYNPYKYSSFVYLDDEQPISTADSAYLVNRKIFI